MEELERINKVEKLLVDTEEITKTLNEMYYKKNYDKIEIFKGIKESDEKFKACRRLLKTNLRNLKECLETNFNLFLALQLHLGVMNKEIEKLDKEKYIDEEVDPLTVKQSDIEEDEKDKNICECKACDNNYNNCSPDNSETD